MLHFCRVFPLAGLVTQCRISVFNSIYTTVSKAFCIHTSLCTCTLLLLNSTPKTPPTPIITFKEVSKNVRNYIVFEIELKMLEIVYCLWMLKSESIESMYFETEYCLAAPAASTIVAGCCRDAFSYTVSEQLLLCVVIYFVCVNFQKFIQSVMSSEPVLLYTAAACRLPAAGCLLPLFLLPVYSNTLRWVIGSWYY